MDEKRKKLVLEFWDRSNVLNLENKEYLLFVKRVINEKLREDIGKGDITTNSLISKNAQAKAVVIAKQNGIVAGIDESSLLFENCRIAKNKTNGDIVKNKEIIFEVAGNARKILSCERTALNVMQRMSGIATLTSNLNKIIENRCFIIGTRKTAFGMMDKAAISCGKGLTHRINLNDGILIKDNHLKFLNNDFEKALFLASKANSKYVEVEVNNKDDALKCASIIANLKTKKLFAIMFDNMNPEQIKSSLIKIKNIPKTENLLFEASGNITPDNLKEYSMTGIDVLSLGFLTHSVNFFNLSMEAM